MNFRKTHNFNFVVLPGIASALFLCNLSISLAQADYQNGYVVTQEKDTLYGLVKDRTKEPFGELYTKIRLKQERALLTKKFSASDLLSYKRGDDIFESIWLSEESAFLKTRYINKKGVGEQVFMQLMARGELSYYHWEWRDPDSGY